MSIRCGAVLAIGIFLTGCCAIPPAALEISVPISKTTPPPAPPLPGIGAHGLADLIHAQRILAMSGTKAEVRTVSLSKRQVKREVDSILDSVRYAQYDEAARLLTGTTDPKLAAYLQAYFEAYFRELHFVKVDGVVKPQDSAFYNRAGYQFAFPVITISRNPGGGRALDVTKIEEVALVGDLMRVAIEAFADAHFSVAVLADATATGCTKKLIPDNQCVKDTETARFKQLKCVINFADKTEAITGAVAAEVVRGGWWAALNNEALAKAFQVAISVTARKAAEELVTRDNLCPPETTFVTIPARTTLKLQLVD